MTVAEIVRALLQCQCDSPSEHWHTGSHDSWSQDDYEKAWLVIRLIIEKWERLKSPLKIACEYCDISYSDYAELERRVREWEKDHG